MRKNDDDGQSLSMHTPELRERQLQLLDGLVARDVLGGIADRALQACATSDAYTECN